MSYQASFLGITCHQVAVGQSPADEFRRCDSGVNPHLKGIKMAYSVILHISGQPTSEVPEQSAGGKAA
ncbi:MAG: hypothetical protein P8P71_10655 [Phycisphaerales bacterium]|nr:hypothetical protein [Phycisphaerales bacterium]